MKEVAELISLVINNFDETKDDVAARVQELCRKHPLYE